MYDVKDSELANLEEDDFDTVLATDISFRGTIKFSKPFMIRGTVVGTIDATSDLVVDTGAEVVAGIGASRVLVRGKVEGNITAKRLVIVTASGMVTGDITAPQVVLEPGAHFSGRCSMVDRADNRERTEKAE
ncbi:MAG: polymer-forming cytoskeletal protein [Treponema sp.]|nr:polymer-forming cytoskeletal protein [Treponema sp.]